VPSQVHDSAWAAALHAKTGGEATILRAGGWGGREGSVEVDSMFDGK